MERTMLLRELKQDKTYGQGYFTQLLFLRTSHSLRSCLKRTVFYEVIHGQRIKYNHIRIIENRVYGYQAD